MYRKEGWHDKMHITDVDIDVEHTGPGELEIEERVEVQNMTTHKVTEKSYKITFNGLFNIVFLLGVIGGVLFSGKVHLGEADVLGIHVPVENLIRDLFLVCMGLLSLKFTPKAYREGNGFSWFPIVEVAKLFAGIFITIIPALAMLRAGEQGQLKFVIDAVQEPSHYFWITGTLSSFLDNAPTYLVFFNTALGKFGETVVWLMDEGSQYLLAISCGAVFFGANTYIGNAPNFMVKSIAEGAEIKMPSFFGYMGYSTIVLVPLFVLTTLIFF
jgi:Na+/H+ antiporter NhaD/arsenite permease-like protein